MAGLTAGPPRATLVGISVSHTSAPLRVLEQVSRRRGEVGDLLQVLHAAGCLEVVVLSTCSRTEVYATLRGDPQRLVDVLADHSTLSRVELAAVAAVRTDRAVVRHLFRVTAGLESRVRGEVEVLGQVRTAFRQAQRAGLTGPVLGRIFPPALRCGARVREVTGLGAEGRSLARRAVDLGLAMVGDLSAPSVLVVGSGHMAMTALGHLTALGYPAHVAARDLAGATRLASPGLVCPLPALARGIAGADLLLCATSAAVHVVTLDHVRTAMQSRTRPLTVVDLSVPRNVDPRIGTVPGVRLLDLESMNDDTAPDPVRAAAVRQGDAVVEAALQRYDEDQAARRVGPVIAALRAEVERTCLAELTRLAPDGAIDLARLTHTLAGKVLHPSIVLARAAALAGDTELLRLLCDVHGVWVPGVSCEQVGPVGLAS